MTSPGKSRIRKQSKTLNLLPLRFVPTNLRVKREEKKEPPKRKTEPYRPYSSVGGHSFVPPPSHQPRFARPSHPVQGGGQVKTKDDAYADFMKEMQDLL